MPPPQPTPVERFGTLLLWLGNAVVTRGHFGLSSALIALIIIRIGAIKQRFDHLAALIREGRYTPRRRSSTPRSPGIIRKRSPNPLPLGHGWLLKLVPDAIGYRAQLENLLRDPEMAALLAAAPEVMGRPLRSLCRMLRLDPPEILALPAKPRPPRPEKPPAPPKAAKPPPLQQPAWMPHRTRWTLARIRGSPRNA